MKLLQQIIKFGMVGVMATLIDFALLSFLVEVCQINYLLAAAISFIASTIFNYLASMRYVFSSRFGKEQRHQEASLFLVLSLIGLALNQFFMWFFVEKCGLFYVLAKILATVLVMAWNFISRKIWLEAR
ncbi:GtrA family protein [Atopobacter sp. AH10]|uniref:GtrA family protein n=1 Tax=Atopobacter sp. AH10 TaxID=2315861 RepID=UPI000EF23EC6|nr:GtrA family protein [Atopobacter sp. AH10]RLK63943.1 GtrA family protein [Atopobacter sp. AH10]